MRPTSSLIGPLHVASVFGYFVISLGYLVGALYLMQSDKNYVPWPTRLSQGASWWTLGDNWESTWAFLPLRISWDWEEVPSFKVTAMSISRGMLA